MKLAKLTKSFLKSVACIFALVSISSCQEDMETMYMQSSENTVLIEQLNAAKRWYEIQKSNGKTRSVDSQMQMYKEDPSWKYFAVNRRKDFTAVDIDLTDCISLDFVPQDNYEAFQRTGNWDFRRSYTRLVYTFDKKNNKEKGFLMTIVPSKYYAKTYSKRIRRNTYLHRDKYLSGYVLFHHLDGTFANGWEYKRGKVIRKVNMKMQTGDLNSGRILMHTLSANYTVTPKVYSPTQTRSDSEGDGDIDGGWLGEVVITPDPDPDPYPDLPTSWVDWLDDPDPEPDPDDGWYWDDEDDGYVGSEDSNVGNDPHADFDKTVQHLTTELTKKGIDMSKYVIVKGKECSANARVSKGKIEICSEFYRWGANTQVAIVWHEIYHVEHDKPCNTNYINLAEPIIRTPPVEIRNLILSEIEQGYGSHYVEMVYNDYITFECAFDPAFIQNEINTYTAEMEKFSAGVLDTEYANHRYIELWQAQQKLDIANTYYKE